MNTSTLRTAKEGQAFFVAALPELPGAFGYGETVKEATSNLLAVARAAQQGSGRPWHPPPDFSLDLAS
jgi:predicted RNase H-like HicB family nuclease